MMRPAIRRRTAVLGCLVLALALSLLTSCKESGRTAPMATGTWAIDFQDRFSGARVVPSRWTTCFWWAKDGCTILTNDEDEWYDPAQASVSDGSLHLTARAQPSRHLGRTFTHTSGMVSSGRSGNAPTDAARYAFTYGYVEVRFRTPAGGGLWPAIWLLPVTNRSLPEIDLLEQYGSDTRRASMTLHSSHGRNRTTVTTRDLSSGWHTVGLEWTKGRLRWYLDGTQRFEVVGDRVPAEPMYLVMNLAVGGNAGTPPRSTRFPSSFLVDQVTVWKQS